ncbi:MAG TPA: TIGR03118 family protein [Terriglobales bacterium]|nr:TIGR03118 family protein [Terriglobales bacterium]
MSRPQSLFYPVALLALCLSILAGNALAQHYTETDLTANRSGISNAANIDPNLVNPWGLSRSSGSPWWDSDNGTGLSTLYDLNGVPQSLVVTIPPPKGQNGTAAPSGTVYNYTTSFEAGPGAPAIFLFATEDGTISGWNPNVNQTNAVLVVDHNAQGAIYKGIALASLPGGPRLYVSNFASGQVEVYDAKFHQIKTGPGDFTDSKLPLHYAPFGIQNVGNNIVITFAQRSPGSTDENHGPGLGYVDVFDTRGNLLLRLQHGQFMNAPWGIAESPADFGAFSHRLLIGNFGDGKINVFNEFSGNFEGQLLNADGSAISIDGLWALSFGGGNTKSGAGNTLYFTAGLNDEADGLFGNIVPVSAEQRGNTE